MPDQNLTEIVVLLDRSGSMTKIARDMTGGFDEFIRAQRATPGACVVTLVQFDTESIDPVYTATPVDKVGPLVLVPRGGTPLLDAMGRTIAAVGERLANTPDDRRPGRVLFVAITDGEENSSREFSLADVKRAVEHQTTHYAWQFSFLGANMDAFAEAGGMGITRGAVMNYAANPAGVKRAFSVLSASVSSYRGGGTYELPDDAADAPAAPPAVTKTP